MRVALPRNAHVLAVAVVADARVRTRFGRAIGTCRIGGAAGVMSALPTFCLGALAAEAESFCTQLHRRCTTLERSTPRLLAAGARARACSRVLATRIAQHAPVSTPAVAAAAWFAFSRQGSAIPAFRASLPAACTVADGDHHGKVDLR